MLKEKNFFDRMITRHKILQKKTNSFSFVMLFQYNAVRNSSKSVLQSINENIDKDNWEIFNVSGV